MRKPGSLTTGTGPAICASLALLAASAPALAETVSQLDSLSRATDDSESGIALARRQIADGQLLEALGTLERLLINDPENLEARALHAGTLCRIDDRRGAITEFDTLRNLDVPPAVSEEARRPCRQSGG